MILAIDLSAISLANAWPALIPFILLLGAWPIVRLVVIPLGLPRVSYVLTHFAFLGWGASTRTGAIIAAAWAALRSKRDLTPFLDALEEQLHQKRLGVPEATAYGLIAAKRGHLDDARAILSTVDELSKNHPPSLARSIAAEWAVADAAARGEWQKVAKVARVSEPFARSRATRLIGDVAARLIGEEEVPAWRLWLRWMIAPRRWWTCSIVQRATKQAPGSASKSVRPEPVVLPSEGEPLLRAITLAAALWRRTKDGLLDEDLFRLARAWDEALLDGALAARIEVRARELGVPNNRALAELADQVQSDVVLLARRSSIPLRDRDPGPTLVGAKKKLTEESLSEIELSARALEQRVQQKKRLPAIDEWREWLVLRRQAELAVEIGGPKLHRLAFAALHGPMCSLAVWLFNERRENHAAHAIFHWLLTQAQIVDDLDAVRLQQGNVAASATWF